MGESISHLQGWRLGSEFFNALVAPDATGLLLRWLADPEAFKQTRQNLTIRVEAMRGSNWME